ncbi:MAG: nucleotidyltransferase family protein [Candidatus Berkelbacteria bacterium]
MKAFVLAAGLGTRLKPLTDTTPKPMLKVGDKPLLEHQLLWLRSHGVTEIIMNLFYFPDQIEGYFGNGERFGLKIRYILEKDLSGTAGPITKAQDFFNEKFFVIYGDNLTNINLTKLLDFHESKKGIATIALYYEKHPESKGIVELDKNARVISFKEKPPTDEITSHWANTGIYVCNPEIIQHIPEGFCDFGRDLFPALLTQNLPLFGYKTDDFLLDIGTHENYEKAKNEIKNMDF